jgi:hypothetical protein
MKSAVTELIAWRIVMAALQSKRSDGLEKNS